MIGKMIQHLGNKMGLWLNKMESWLQKIQETFENDLKEIRNRQATVNNISEIKNTLQFSSVQSLSCVWLCDPMNHSTPGLPVHHKLPEFTQTHAHPVSDAIQPSHPLSSPSPPDPNPSQHQGLFQWVNASHEVAKVLQLQLQHQSLQWTSWTDFL